ncbi:uncharacterized protein LOC128548733 [Mercenaria mercenaria]|uniref:uncharacterized protein LOC128548733 n=1 Tax=Mercenaria mercenaria TaxID=6596 RepID=UPI00234E5118|nr:uncharacterized protein LOC128548733 [Mercenaria mercenaria]
MDSFMKTFLLSLFPALPDWLRFEKSSTEILSVQDIKSDLIYGRNMDEISWCTGAPVLPDHLYTVFRFDTGFTLNVMGHQVDIPKPLNSRKFCLIVDLCHGYGGTVFLMIPKESRNFLLDLNIFQTLKEEQNIHILPRGIGISLVNGINANYHTLSDELWNGDLMFTPLLPEVDFWIGGDLIKYDEYFTVDGNADIYLGVPSVQTMMTSIFREEWTGFIDIQLSVSPVLRFKLLGKDYSVSLQLVTASLNTYISFGGSNRKWCGEDSNPQGIFLFAMIEINPFKGVPVLEDIVFSSTNRLHLYVTTDPQESHLEEINLNITNDILELDKLLSNTVSILEEAINNMELALSGAIKAIFVEVKGSVVEMKKIININFNDFLSGNLEELKGHLEDTQQKFYQIRTAVYNFADETEFIVSEAKDNFTNLLGSHVQIIEEIIRNISNHITKSTISSVGNYTGFGFKFTTDWKIFGLKLFGFDFEIVYSKGDLYGCSRFEKVKQLLDGETALRVLGRASREYKLGYFLKYEKGFGLGGAFAIHSNNVILHLQAFVSMLGIKATGDIFISKNGIYFYLEGNIWDIFLVQIEVTAEVGKEWYQLTFNLRGRFVAKARKRRHLQVNTETSAVRYRNMGVFRKARKRRQVQSDSSSFQDSYLDALKKAIRLVSEDAQKRLSQAQAALTSAQSGLTKAQNWLDEKQTAVRHASIIFDNAVEKLERAKEKLEEAKGPLKEAIKKLEAAQKSVDNLCRIRTCSTICIPGVKCGICYIRVWFIKVPYPCCRLTSCMIRFPDPLCVIANIACMILRAAVYILLEIAKIFVRVAMLAFDVAKAAVTAAHFVVDMSRVVLVVAEGILELAKTGLEVAKSILEVAKVALEGVKLVIGAAAKVLEFVIEYGLKNIIDVRNCGFNIELSTQDLPAFEVSCEVNAFRLGWRKIKLKINFKNIVQSIWQAARATIKAIIDIFGGIFSGRKRRDIEFDASSRIHVLLRKIRESGGLNNTDTYFNETIDIVNNITGFRDTGDSDSDNRIELFREKCITITVIQDFMQDAFDSLQYIVNESKSYIDEIDNVNMQLQEYNIINSTTANVTVDSVGINTEYAVYNYNMTEEDIDRAINDSKTAAADDPLFTEIQSAANISAQIVDAEKKAVESVNYQSAWFSSMKNMTREYFNESECEDFQDCIFYSISNLYALYESEDLPNITNIQKSILELERILLETFQNESSSIMDTSVAMGYIVSHINDLVSMNLFCSEAPQFLTLLQNQTALNGSDVQFYCHVTGDPKPNYSWLKNDTIIPGEFSSRITITDVTDKDTFDKYNCVAGNVVANVTSNGGYITVVLEDEDECLTEGSYCQHVCNNTIGSYVCSCFTGYMLEEDGISCSDSNECNEDNGGCDQTCNNTEGSFTCSCNDGYELQTDARTCTDINECLTNRGGCQHKCINNEGSFACSCVDGYKLNTDGATCIDINECLTNNGGCQHKCINENGSFTCSCDDGYELHTDGTTCIDINECLTNNGGCQHKCINENGSFTCSCDDGYELHTDGTTCIDINECVTNNGGCQHKCINEEGSFTCSCDDGYEIGTDDRTCNDINECQTDNGGCQHKCNNEEGSFTCSCDDGYKLHTDRTTCFDINECLTNNGGCHHKCINEEGSFTCSCDDGYELHTDERTCTDINECLTGNGGCEHKCTNEEGSFTCSCDDGYELHTDGTTCIDINECLTDKGGCQHMCINEEGSFTCSCDDGYELHTDERTCTDINECLTGNGGCQHKCINENGSFTCSCDDGYELHTNERTCNDINECQTDNGGCQQKCNNEEGSFTCSCDDGYKLHTDRTKCFDINECLTNNGGCQHKCINEEGSVTCSCDDGYEQHTDGTTCIDINECLTNKGGCQHKCINEEGSFTCSCDEGYDIHTDERTCNDINECLTGNGGCQHKCVNEDGSFTCSCDEGYELHTDGTTCIDINECLTNNGGCQHKCTNENGSFTCSCDDGYELHTDGTTCIDINECLTNNGGCQHKCINENGSFTCSCDDGYELHTDRTTCIDINECLTDKGGCQHKCVNKDGSFTCSCDEGYELHTNGTTCIDINECDTDNGKCEDSCYNFFGTYTCACPVKHILETDGLTCKDASKQSLSSSIRLTLDDETAVSNYTVYIEIRKMLELYFSTVTAAPISVFVNSLRRGSVIADYTVVFDEKDVNGTADLIVQAIIDLEDSGTLLFDEKQIHAKSLLPVSATDPCDVREKLAGQCEEGSYCEVVGRYPSCRKVSVSIYKDNNIVYVVIGVVGFLFVLVLLTLCARKIRLSRNKDRHLNGMTTNSSESVQELGMLLFKK